jgi:hypothetical protein
MMISTVFVFLRQAGKSSVWLSVSARKVDVGAKPTDGAALLSRYSFCIGQGRSTLKH